MKGYHAYSMDNLETLESKIGLKMDRSLLKTAISTRDARNEHPDIITSNERLEFLGDSVLKLVLSEYLYHNTSDPEGNMTIIRIALEKNRTLGKLGKQLDIKKHLFLSNHEKQLKDKGELTLLADSMEAIIGAIYLNDPSLCDVRTFVEKHVLDTISKVLKQENKNPIMLLQEYCQKKYKTIPNYKDTQVSGPAHNPTYLVQVFIEKKKIGESRGASKQEAKELTAKKALEILLRARDWS